MNKQTIDLGEYKIVIEHGDKGYLSIIVQDELGEDIEGLTISDEEADEATEEDGDN